MKPNNKRLRHLTPFLILELALLYFSIHLLITDGDNWGGLIGIVGLITIVILLIVDWLLKKFLQTYLQVFIVEIIIAVVGIWVFT